MITKGILKTINYNENSCTVRIPLFETTSSTNEVVLPAIFLTQPGSYNGYSEGDVVFVDFENNSLSNPIIIGKLYLGAIKEKATSKKGGLTIADLSVTSSATLPLDTKLTFNAADETVASVEGGYNTYKSLLDIIKALYKTETSVSKTTEEALENITKIKVEYLSQLVTDPEPLKEDPNWSISMPNYKDGYNIWQKTTCYNSKGQILSTEIICLSAANAIASYWLRCSTKIHSGTQQAETIEITAMTKLGTSPETADEESSLTYRWSKGADKKPEVADPETPYKLIFRNTADAPLPNENLIITAYRNGAIYESETIFFSPLNTPTLVLTNENASLEYDSYGFTKMPGAAEFVESTAVIKLNNETITAKSYEWTVKNCSFDSKIGTNTATIRITDIDESSDSATATCEAIYVDNVGNEVPLTKVFSISKIKQGRSLYKLDLSNEFVTIPAVDDGKGSIKIADDYDWDYLTSHTVNAYYGDELLKVTCSTQTPSSSASEKAFHLKYTVNNVSLKSEINQATESESVTFVLDNLTGKTGTILYELFRGNKKVASSKFEATRLDSGTPATSYWLNISSPIHTGARQESDIKIQPKLETGNSGQDNDILAYIRCKYVGETSYIEVSKNVDTGEVTLTAPLKDKNILVEASHTEDFSNIYESETITFSPLNTPVIDLTNDSAALTYTAGGLKINKEEGKEDVVESTATLYLNGKPVEGVTYSWTYTDCIIEGTTNSQTIKIKGLLAPKGTATCSVSYWGETFTKVFSITKQIQGEASTSYWLKTSCVVHTGTNQEKAIEAIAMKKVGEEAEKPDGTAKLYYRYYNDENWIGGSSTLKIENYKNEDLYIVASHKESFIPNKTLEQADSDIYDWETITFSPLNTPVLDLTNDSDSLTYNAENNKIELPGQTASVTSTAALYLNGDEVSGATYSWTVEGCSTTDYTVSPDNKTITINAISEDSLNVKATCNATYNGKTYSKVFSVVKQVIATTYWLKVSHPVHVGTNQTEQIRIVAMKKEGTSAETLDNTAYLWYKYKNDTTWTKAEGSSAYVLNINSGWKDQDLTIFASHKSKEFTNDEVTETSTEIYDWEVITFSPLNTPTINLTNDTASLVYNYDDTPYSNDVVSTTAELYLNGTHITAGLSYEWTADDNKCTFEGTTTNSTIQIKSIATGSPTATATCKITIDANGIGPNKQFAGRSYEKKFVVVKQFKGDPTTTYELNLSHSAINLTEFNDDFIVKVGKKVGLQPVHFLKAFSAGEEGAEFIYDDAGGNAGAAGREGLDLYIVAYVGSTMIAAGDVRVIDNTGYKIPTTGVSKDNSLRVELYSIDATANSVLLDTKAVTILEDGAAGESAYKLEIENDFVTIPTDFEGTIHLTEKQVTELTTHSIKLYYGSELQLISQYANGSNSNNDTTIATNTGILLISNNSEGITDTGVTSSYTNSIKSLTANTGSITYDAYVGAKKVATAKFEISKVKSGEPTTYYKLEPECSILVCHGTTTDDKGNISYNNTPESLKVYCYKYSGSEKTQVSDFFVKYRVDDGTLQRVYANTDSTNHPGYAVFPTNGTENKLELELYLVDSKGTASRADDQPLEPCLDRETINVVYDGTDGAGGDVFEVQQVYLWTDKYEFIPELPTGTESTFVGDWTQEEQWKFLNGNIGELPSENTMEDLTEGHKSSSAITDWKLVFTSTRVKTEHANGSTPTYSDWTAPTIYLCKDWKSYYTVTISEGLFGNGQGVYYTYDPTAEVFKDDQDKEINPPDTITIAGTEYKIGEQIKKTQEEIAQWVATANLKEPLNTVDNRKKVIKLYVDAKYIRTGALTVGDSNNPLFQAGLDENKVSIGGFTVENNKLCSGSGGGHIALQSGDSKLMSSTQAEYIMSTGEQYINTGITYNANTAYKLTARIAFTTVEPANQILGFTGHAGTGMGTTGNKWWEIGSAAGNIVPNTIYNIEWSLNGTNFARGINGQIVEGTGAPINIPTHYTLNLFATQHTSTNPTISWWQHMKLYDCQIYVDGKLVKNYVPVQRNGKYGLFNTVDSTFTTGEGTDFLGSLKENEAAYINKNGKNYRRVSYIQNKGGQDRSSFNYIDTDVIVNYDEGFTIEAEYEPAGDTTQSDTTSRCCIASNYINEAGNISLEIMQGSSRFYLNNGWSWDHAISGVELNKKSKSIFSYANGTATHSLEGKDTASLSTTISGNAGSNTLRIFCDRYPDANDGLPGRMDTFYVPLKLYYLKISKGASVARYYLPVVEEATNKVGLLDIIHGTFLTQTAGVDFSYAELPPTAGETFKDASNNTYTTLSYLKSTGSQYINTGVKASNNTSIEVDCEVLTPYSVYGTLNGLNYTASPEYPGGYFYYYNIHNAAGAGAPIAANSRMIVKQDKNKCYRNGLLVHTYTSSTFTEKSNMLLFARNGSTDGGVTKNDAGSVKIYYCKIWEANALIRDFIPVLKNGAEYGMYERVEGKFYSNSGTDIFSGEGIVSHEFNSIYLGSDIEATAPFRVTNTGKLFATGATISGNISADSGTIGGFSLSDTTFKTLRTENNGYGNVDNPDVLITTRGYSQWGKVANRDGTDWRLLIGQNFGIAQGGILYCDQALVKGNIVATSGEIQNMTQITADYISAKNTLSGSSVTGDTLTANTNIVAPQATIADFELKAVNTSNIETKTKTVSLKLTTETTKHVSNIATYIGGSWLFTLTFACFEGETQQTFIESRSFADLVSIQWATFESNTTKTTTIGSTTSTSNIVSKVYFNSTTLNAFSGSNNITITVSGGGNGASPSASWKLSEVYLKVKNSSGGWDYHTITTSGSEVAKITNFKYKGATNNTKLLLNGGVVINGNLTPQGGGTLGEESTPWTKAFITEVYATTFYASSDKRLKENIKEFIPQKSILELPVVEFDFKNTKSHQIGCIAQDLQEICPELVTTSETGYLAISENKLVYLLLLELKKLHSKVTMLEDELKRGTK